MAEDFGNLFANFEYILFGTEITHFNFKCDIECIDKIFNIVLWFLHRIYVAKVRAKHFTCPFKTLGFLPRKKQSVIGLFGRVMNNNVELCCDWLFYSAARFISSQEWKKGRKIYISILSHTVISLGNYTVNKMRASGPLLIYRALKLLSNGRLLTFTFEIRDRTYSVYTTERQYLSHILQDQMLVSGAQGL